MSEFENGLKQLKWTNKKASEVFQKDAKTIYRWRKQGAPLIVMLLMSVMLERQKEAALAKARWHLKRYDQPRAMAVIEKAIGEKK